MCKTRTLINLNSKVILCAFVVATGFAYAQHASANSIDVHCTEAKNSADRIAIQKAVNSVTRGSGINLRGICQLDGKNIYITRSNLTITRTKNTVARGIASSQ